MNTYIVEWSDQKNAKHKRGTCNRGFHTIEANNQTEAMKIFISNDIWKTLRVTSIIQVKL